MLAVDISESMLAEDMELNGAPANRLMVVKSVVGDFVRRREGDRLGLILFGSNAYLHVPLSFDRETVRQLLNEAQVGFAGKQTAIGDALGIAVKRLQDRPESSRVLILLTDGANTAGQIAPRQAAELAAQQGLRVYTIGVGAEAMELPGLFGSAFGARRINPSADLDEDTLQYIASATGGRYFRARDQQELEAIYAELDRLEPVEQEAESYRPLRSLHHWPLGAALLLSLALASRAVLRPRVRRRDPAAAG
jgi:Ca-activated chloride channel family protein